MRALLSSYEKDEHLRRLGKLLMEHGWTLLGSSGTAKYLNDQGIACRDIAEIAGPPILGHRVVTLSREIHAALLAVTKEDFVELERLGIEPINLVYVTLYPLEEALADPAVSDREVIEKTDIGGPTLLRSAAKGCRLALSDPSHIDLVHTWFVHGSPETERDALVTKLASAAERRVADYVDASARYWEGRV